MKLSTLCSGIGAPEVAAKRLGWECLWGAEVDPHASAVLAHHHPESVNLGDVTKIKGGDLDKPDVLVFGSPCQSFSVAGKRAGLDDPRGDITLECLRIVGELLPEWVVWENVPGVLSIDGGRTFGTVLGILAKLGYGFAYAIRDAQFFGVPQRRRRVFVVGCLGDWRRAAAVLFERESLCGHPAPSREKGERVAPTVAVGPPFSRTGNDRVESEAMVIDRAAFNQGEGAQFDPYIGPDMPSLVARGPHAIAHSLTKRHDSSEDGTGRGTPLVSCFEHHIQDSRIREIRVAGTLNNQGGGKATLPVAVAYGFNGDQSEKTFSMGEREEQSPTVRADGPVHVAQVQWASGGGQVENPTAQALRAGAEHNYQFLRISSPIDSLEWKEYTSLQGGPYNGPEEGTRSREILRLLRGKVGEEVFEEWGLGVLASLSQAGLLQQEVHGEGLRFAPVPRHGIFNEPFPFEKTCTYGEMRTVWRRECLRRTSQKWKLEGQLKDELGAYLSQLSFEGTPQAKALHYLRETTEGVGLLQQTLDTFQEIWRPECLQDSAKEEMQTLRRLVECEGSVREALHAGKTKGGPGVMSVRRLTPL